MNYNVIKYLTDKINAAGVSPSAIASSVAEYLNLHPPASYTHPSTHPATMITDDATHRFMTDTEKSALVTTTDPRLTDTRTPRAHVHEATDVNGIAVLNNDARLSDARDPKTHTHPYEPANANIQTHIGSTHAPSNAVPLATVKADIDIANAITLKHSNSQDHTHSNGATLDAIQAALTTALKGSYDAAVVHAGSSHAPSNAQKNSDIIISEIEAKLTGVISTHSHATPTWKSGIATRDIGAASGSQTIAHGLGRVPKFVRIEGAVIISAAITSQCTGVFDGTNNNGLAIMWGEGTSAATTEAIYTSTSIALGFTTAVATNAFTGANRQTGIITVDATNITITWTKTGTVASLVASLLWQCT
jgi:hypothetical protein